MDKHMTEAEDALTPLAEMFMENAELVADLKQLHAKAETAFQDMGDDLDAMCALRDTTIYLALKMREDRLKNPNYAQQTHERLEKDLQRMRERRDKEAAERKQSK